MRVPVAGEPTGCSGKANAVAHACSRASHDRPVWTDADVRRDTGWLGRLVAAGEAHGPATAVPVFRGGGWWRLVEPWTAALFSLPQVLCLGSPGLYGRDRARARSSRCAPTERRRRGCRLRRGGLDRPSLSVSRRRVRHGSRASRRHRLSGDARRLTGVSARRWTSLAAGCWSRGRAVDVRRRVSVPGNATVCPVLASDSPSASRCGFGVAGCTTGAQ